MGRADLIGNGKQHLIPSFQPATAGGFSSARRKNSTPAAPKPGRLLTQHTGLPPREVGAGVRQKTAAMAPRRKLR